MNHRMELWEYGDTSTCANTGPVKKANSAYHADMVLAQKNGDLWPQAVVKVAFAHIKSINETMGMLQYDQ